MARDAKDMRIFHAQPKFGKCIGGVKIQSAEYCRTRQDLVHAETFSENSCVHLPCMFCSKLLVKPIQVAGMLEDNA